MIHSRESKGLTLCFLSKNQRIRRCQVLLGALALMALSGCSTPRQTPTIASLPQSNADFMLGPSELRKTYPDIEKHEGPWAHGFFGSVWYMPAIEEVTSKLGEPDEERPSWWNLEPTLIFAAAGWPFAWVLGGSVFGVSVPTSVYLWQKPNYDIEAVVDYPFALDYTPHLMYWRWYYKPGKTADMEANNQE